MVLGRLAFLSAALLAATLASPPAAAADGELTLSTVGAATMGWFPPEHCRRGYRQQEIICHSAAPTGSTVGVKFTWEDCYVDFDKPNGKWRVKAYRGPCHGHWAGANHLIITWKS